LALLHFKIIPATTAIPITIYHPDQLPGRTFDRTAFAFFRGSGISFLGGADHRDQPVLFQKAFVAP
jgi:hypothetical protein